MTTTRGTTNRNARGGSDARRRRREWLVETFRADMDLYTGVQFWNEDKSFYWPNDADWFVDANVDPSYYKREPCCRCYRCGKLLTVVTVSVDRRTPGCQGGTYKRENIRPACEPCNSKTGGSVRGKKKSC